MKQFPTLKVHGITLLLLLRKETLFRYTLYIGLTFSTSYKYFKQQFISEALRMYRIDEASCNELPPKLSALLESLNESLVNQDQHIVILLHYLMIESGFNLHNTSKCLENIDNVMPRVEILNNKGAGYRINYIVDSDLDTRCTLHIVPSRINVVING